MAEMICNTEVGGVLPASAMQQQPQMFTPEELFWSHHQAQLAAAGYGPQVIYSDLYAQQAQQVQPAQQAQHFMFEQRAMQSYAAVPRLQFKCWA